MITIRRISADDALLLREVRLRALSDSPGAFGSTYAREVAFDTGEWESRARIRSTSKDEATFLAFDDQSCVGIIGCFVDPKEPALANIVSMWVAPEARMKGMGRQLLQAAEDWARRRELSQLALDVVENNACAIAFYRRYGFEFTGQTDQHPNDPTLRELLMIRAIRP